MYFELLLTFFIYIRTCVVILENYIIKYKDLYKSKNHKVFLHNFKEIIRYS